MQNQRAKWKKKKKSPSQPRSGSVLGNHSNSDNHSNHFNDNLTNHFGNQHENNNTNDVNYTTNFDINNWRLESQPLDINLEVENWNPDSFNQFML